MLLDSLFKRRLHLFLTLKGGRLLWHLQKLGPYIVKKRECLRSFLAQFIWLKVWQTYESLEQTALFLLCHFFLTRLLSLFFAQLIISYQDEIKIAFVGSYEAVLLR